MPMAEMSPPTPVMVKEIRSQLSSIMDTHVGTPSKADIDKELMHILKALVAFGHHRVEEEPIFRQLFDWLMHPQRTVEEFNYVLGPLVQYVNTITYDGSMLYVAVAALEALAVKCPVLEGPWEISLWLIMRIVNFSLGDYFTPSNRLSAWIFHMIGDADLCPNAYLRIDLMYFLKMVRVSENWENNRTQVFEAVMSACTNLNNDYLMRNECIDNYSYCSMLSFKAIVNRVTLVEYGLEEFGGRLAKKLNDVNSSRLSSMAYDVTYSCGLNPNMCTEPRELQTLIALLNITGGYAKGEFNKLEQHMSVLSYSIDKIMEMFLMFIMYFKFCCQMPQLTYPTASFVIDVLEFVIRHDLIQPIFDYRGFAITTDDTNMMKIDHLLQELLIDNGSVAVEKSHIGREIISRNSRRLKSIRERVVDFDEYPTISSLMKHV